MSTIVEIAALLFLFKVMTGAVKAKHRRVELKAAKAEYEANRNLENEVDETIPRWMQEQRRERYRERQRQLLMRYPEAIVAGPDLPYYRQVEQEEKEKKIPFKEDFRENWKWWLLSVGMFLGMWALVSLAKALWASL